MGPRLGDVYNKDIVLALIKFSVCVVGGCYIVYISTFALGKIPWTFTSLKRLHKEEVRAGA